MIVNTCSSLLVFGHFLLLKMYNINRCIILIPVWALLIHLSIVDPADLCSF